MEIKYLDAHQLAKLLSNGLDLGKTLVIDVRDDDFSGGHIKNCINLTTDMFEDDDDLDSLIARYCPGKERLVFHCMMSQKRGPFCARRAAGRLALANIPNKPNVYILERGFKYFRSVHPELCDDLE